jgi:DNA (cytosine-5)-methyltransferase 1
MNELRLIDTFSGIGGFSYAAEKLVGGFKTVAFVECEPYCQKVLKKHWPHVEQFHDIRTYNPEPYSADAICGGFPCQDISQAGLQAGITKETRSGLFFQLMRIICLVRPKYIVLENVAAILFNGLGIVLGELAQAGYDTEYACIPASALGACHKRDRFWLVAYPSSDRLQRKIRAGVSNQTWSQKDSRRINPDWRRYKSKPVLDRGSDGLSNWIHRTKALGNSVCPQVAAIPLQRVLDLEKLTVSS